MIRSTTLIFAGLIFFSACSPEDRQQEHATSPLQNSEKNIVFILSDDHRYDFMGFMGKVPFLVTPNMDRMAREGAQIEQAFVSTSLCSPSRASILTGQYAHRHGVVDNQSPIPEEAVFFPEFLQKSGYQTAYIGKWHMGEGHDNPRPGFDYWASFKGQGTYFNPPMNVNGERVIFDDSTYVTDLLTDYALEFLDARNKAQPFFMCLSHKAVHSEFYPAPRHRNKYIAEKINFPKSMYPPGHQQSTVTDKEYNYTDVPNWVKAQRYSWHGVDHMYHGAYDFENFFKRYCESLLALDESIGKVLDYLEQNNLLENTLVVYMGDNGFSFGEHGLIDKRHAYEESMRVPMLVMAKGDIEPAKRVKEVIQNIDLAPTLLEWAGVSAATIMDGASFLPLLQGKAIAWKDTIYYEYFWERPFPQTPTVHAVRTNRYKFIRYHGVWDINELYDLQQDPEEMNNLIRDTAYAKIAEGLRDNLFSWLEQTDGGSMLLKRDEGQRFDHRYRGTY